MSGTVSISGTPCYGETLTAGLTDGNNTGDLTYTWTRGGTPVGTGASFTVGAEDIGQTLTCTVTSSVQTGSVSTTTATVAKAPLTVTAKDQEYVYNGQIRGEGDTVYTGPAEIAKKVTVEGLQGGDALTSVILNGQGTDVGEYPIVPCNATIGTATDNYDITYVAGKLTITANDPPAPTPTPSSGGSGAAQPFSQPLASAVPSSFDGGKVAISPASAGFGTTVTLTVTPDEGMRLAELRVDRIGGDPVELTKQGENTFSFTMPGWRIAVNAQFEPIPADEPPQPGAETAPAEDTTLPPGNLPGVVLSPQRITVNGAEANVEAYNIGGTNYFSLRDLAALLRDTNARFNVAFDASRDAVVVVRGEGYGGALNERFTDRSRRTVPSYQTVLLDGAPVSLTAYNIGGNNFFGLRELAAHLGYSVDYDEETNTASIESR